MATQRRSRCAGGTGTRRNALSISAFHSPTSREPASLATRSIARTNASTQSWCSSSATPQTELTPLALSSSTG
eukprot:13487787-Alexandrium_andersonii.AAC.1